MCIIVWSAFAGRVTPDAVELVSIIADVNLISSSR